MLAGLMLLLPACSTLSVRSNDTSCTESDLVLCDELRDAQAGERFDYYVTYLKFRYQLCQMHNEAKAECITKDKERRGKG